MGKYQESGGWYLPAVDSYFPAFVDGASPKQNGFQREHLHEALKYVKNWDVAVDVGAHCGFWAYDIAQKFGTVHCFEPASDSFSCLELNLSEFNNVELYNAAAGDVRGYCTIREDKRRAGNTGARFIGPGTDTLMMTVDGLHLDACDFFKIDVEGFEYQVLCGARDTIRKFNPVIIMETDKKFADARFGVAHDEAEKFLLSNGYGVAAHMRPDKIFVPAGCLK